MSPEQWKKIEDVFDAVADLPMDERQKALLEASQGDDSVRREVEKLLASLDSAPDFIESPVWTDSSVLNTSAKKELSDSLEPLGSLERDNYLGRQIGAFRLTREIGRGGMGAVYLGERADGEFQQNVAIKLIKRGMDSDFIIKRFRHERQILASFEHPFIARLLDGGTTGEGVPYFVMEYVDGETLYQFCDKNRLGIRDRLKLFQKVCSAIEYAHDNRIIHRDIKPSNILINRARSPKLLDFGIAKILDPNLIHESLNPTASMLRLMTPDYASPEQIQGGDVGPPSDIYSLGVLLYELLSGCRPYVLAGRALHEASRIICEVTPEPPSRAKVPENLLPVYSGSDARRLEARGTSTDLLTRELAGPLDDIVMCALAKDPEARYASASELSRDISRFLSGSQIQAPKFLGGSQKSTRPVVPAPPVESRSLAVLPFRFLNLASGEDTGDRFLGLGLADALITRLSKIRKFVVRPTSSILSFGDDLSDPIAAGSELNVDLLIAGSIKKAGDRVRVTVQLLDVKENAAVWATSIDEVLSDVFTLEDTLSTRVIDVLLPQLTGSELAEFAKRGTEVPEAFEQYLRGRYHFNSFTEEGLAKAFVCFHRAIASDPSYAHAYAGIADYYNWLGIMGVLPPQECFLPAIESASRAVELDPELSEAQASLGFSLHAGAYDWSAAERHLRTAIELNPSNANAYVWYSIVLSTEGRFDEALNIAAHSVEVDPLTPFNHHNIGWILYFARRYEVAAEKYRRVIADFPTYSFGYYGLSKIYRFTGETQMALQENARAIELMGASVFSLLSEAECYAADGQTEVALEKIARLEAMSSERYVSPYQLSLAYCFLATNGDTARSSYYRNKAVECLLAAYEAKESWLNWLGAEPAFDVIREDPRVESLLEQVGYRHFFRAFAASHSSLDKATPVPDKLHDLTTLMIDGGELTDDGVNRHDRSRGWYPIAAASTLLAVVLGIVAYLLWPSPPVMRPLPAATAFKNPAIVVLPFASDDPETRDLGVGLADAVAGKLGNIKDLQVLSAGFGRSVDRSQLSSAAEEYGIRFALTGTLAAKGPTNILSAQLIDAATGVAVWTEDLEAPADDLFSLQAKLAEKVLTSLGITPLPLERQQVLKSHTIDPGAYRSYLLGRFQLTNRSEANLKQAISAFSSAAAADGNFALAYAGLADAYSLLNLYSIDPPPDAYERAKENAMRALAIDPDLAEAHASLAYIKFYHDRDRAGSELEFRRAIQLNPSYSQAHHWFALVLAARGRSVEALSEIETALRLDPRSASVGSAEAMIYYFDDRFGDAVIRCDRILSSAPDFVPALKVKRWALSASGDRAGAAAVFERELAASGGSATDAGWKITEIEIRDPAGDARPQLVSELERASSDPSVRDNRFAFAFEVALAWNNLGDTARTFEWLSRADAARAHNFNFLSVDPRFANLRQDPRFQKLVSRLEASETAAADR